MSQSRLVGALCVFVMLLVTTTANASLVTMQYQGTVSFSSSGGFSVPLGTQASGSLVYTTQGAADDTNPDPELAEYTNSVQSFSLSIATPIGNPPTSIAGPLDLAASTVEIDNGNIGTNTDFYTFNLSILNGPILSSTQPNGFVQTRTLTRVLLDSGQNSNPIGSTDLDENLFSAFQPGSGTQPQRMLLGISNNGGPAANFLTINFDPTSITVSAVPIPPAIWLFGTGLLGLVGIARRKKTT